MCAPPSPVPLAFPPIITVDDTIPELYHPHITAERKTVTEKKSFTDDGEALE